MEITTRIGCKINCSYCPQGTLIRNYTKDSRIIEMSLDTFKTCMDKVPHTHRIDFSGMSEPFLNSSTIDMMQYAVESGFSDMVLYSTLEGLKFEDIHRLKDFPFSIIEIHLADQHNNSKITVDENYLKNVEFTANHLDCSYMSHGKVNESLLLILKDKQVREISTDDGSVIDRAGNIEVGEKLNKSGKLKCASSGLLYDRNVLLPNGDVLLCCMDYGMEAKLGNLLTDSYEDLNRLKEAGFDICRRCDLSIQI